MYIMSNWDMLPKELKNEILDNYSSKAVELGKILSKIGTLEYCQTLCPENDGVGCCDFNHHLAGITNELLERQNSKANIGGHIDEAYFCKFHSKEKGCAVGEYKSPLCIGYLCDELQGYLSRIDPLVSSEFIQSMKYVAKSSFLQHGELVNSRMDKAIESGRRLEQMVASPKDL